MTLLDYRFHRPSATGDAGENTDALALALIAGRSLARLDASWASKSDAPTTAFAPRPARRLAGGISSVLTYPAGVCNVRTRSQSPF